MTRWPRAGGCLALAASVWIAAIAATGCGSGAASTPSEAHVVALANAVCRSDLHGAKDEALLAQVRLARTRISTILAPAASHPRVGTLLKDLSAREGLIRRIDSPGRTPAFIENLYRARIRVYDDEKALGLTKCLGSPPRKPIFG